MTVAMEVASESTQEIYYLKINVNLYCQIVVQTQEQPAHFSLPANTKFLEVK
jgi:hypothetical protein